MNPNLPQCTTLNGVELSSVQWRKSSFSGGNDNCVEIADLRSTQYAGFAVRDSKLLDGPALLLSPEGFRSFVQHAADGDISA
ncbi:DUF397 domain-containing protein [Streptomyces sp. NBC_01443]|uniref:DUF397 domain-containing protein n=1 Tax=Streptomyces sp. NBC_01443 TaxID=2903868 RepID=UPI002254526B|nr:DUF397 domain-containing protein [Streptomyces sp. NBC_01443]MCX4632827.1 DUF397 domain-containing protein [Streptomyces sp. NBC_01443]